jgi:hypothetical protein
MARNLIGVFAEAGIIYSRLSSRQSLWFGKLSTLPTLAEEDAVFW